MRAPLHGLAGLPTLPEYTRMAIYILQECDRRYFVMKNAHGKSMWVPLEEVIAFMKEWEEKNGN